MEELYVITECCGGPIVAGCESLTIQQVEEWLSTHQEIPETETECGDTVKYIYMPLNQERN
jgi:hypothetical protein